MPESKFTTNESQVQKPDHQPEFTVRKTLPLGWIVLLGPILVVAFVGLFQDAEYLKERSKAGAETESLNMLTRGKLAVKQANYNDAYALYMTALQIQPDNGEAYLNLGILYQQTGKYDLAIASFTKALELMPEQIGVISNNLGTVYGKMGKHDDAMVMFQRATETSSYQASVHRNIGEYLLRKKDYAAAAASYGKAIERKPTLTSAYYKMLQDAVIAKEFIDFRTEIKAALDEGLNEEDAGRYDGEIIERYALRDPKLAEDYLDYALALYKSGEIDQALANCRTSISLQPGVASAHNRLGIILANKGENAAALEAFGEALRLDPQFEEAKSNFEHCQAKLQ